MQANTTNEPRERLLALLDPVPAHPWFVDPGTPMSEELSEVNQMVAWFEEWGVEVPKISLRSRPRRVRLYSDSR